VNTPMQGQSEMEKIVERLDGLEKSQSNVRVEFVGSIIAAVIAAGAAIFGVVQQSRADKDQHTVETRRADTEELNVVNEVKRLYSERLDPLKGDFETQRSTIKVLASLYGVPTAVKVESSFRTAATIRGLQDLMPGLERDRDSQVVGSKERLATEADIERIKDSLEDLPRVLFVESGLESNIYCEDSKRVGATNADDIRELIKSEPIRINALMGDRADTGPKWVADKIMTKKEYAGAGVILVIHGSAFEGTPVYDLPTSPEAKSNQEKAGAFLAHLEQAGFKGKVVVYSRGDSMVGLVREELLKRSPDKKTNLELRLVQLERSGRKSDPDGLKDIDCFKAGKPNGERIAWAVRSSLPRDDFYVKE